MCFHSTFSLIKSSIAKRQTSKCKFPQKIFFHITLVSRKENLSESFKGKWTLEIDFLKENQKYMKIPGFAPFTVATGPSKKLNESYNE